ncbi:MAG: LLM class flavin-dependent oxidoreductase [Segniliparus sp.]|uniref:LLM class flavin-dependent oxidoreductase n=1 Tax=Segniliparus sp. TaxID=2804064 RepID=UPI003F2C03F9
MVFTLGFEIDQGQALTGKGVKDIVRQAQNARLGYVVLRDAPGSHGQIDAVSRAAYAATSTTSLGLVAEVSTTYNEPFHTAVQLQTVDFASYGRAGWLPSRTLGEAHPAALGWPKAADEDAAVEQRDSLLVARALWDSWEDDAVIRDVAAGRFLDRAKVRHIDFTGERFSVKGPSITPRSPQGQIPVFARAGELPPGLADVVITTEPARVEGALAVVALDIDLAAPGAEDALVRHIAGLADEADGVLLRPRSLGEDLSALGRAVTPKLLEAGVIAGPRPGQTLRETLGLARPAAKKPGEWQEIA